MKGLCRPFLCLIPSPVVSSSRDDGGVSRHSSDYADVGPSVQQIAHKSSSHIVRGKGLHTCRSRTTLDPGVDRLVGHASSFEQLPVLLSSKKKIPRSVSTDSKIGTHSIGSAIVDKQVAVFSTLPGLHDDLNGASRLTDIFQDEGQRSLSVEARRSRQVR